MNRFKDKVVVITGASEGIGLATAKAFAAEGANVYVTGRRQERLDAAVREIGGATVGIQGDVGNLSDLDRLYARIQRDHGRVDVVFANAGISETSALGEIDEAHFDRVFGTNVKGMVFSVQKALPLMTRGGTVILAGSASGSKGFPGLSVYNATKAAIRSLARTWTTDLKSRGIRVNVISPGMIETPAMQTYLQNNAGFEDVLKQMTPLGRIGQAEDVANAVLFLAANESSFVAGVEFFVDGGIMAV
ncbi:MULTISPECIES: SDR family NAD(P)-dependent oxidoreductase [unclassified Myxococcus]|jgi:NAD(P)-dependent dehydrogenase (short-subunit alcohol dehydrogenase family)|uniref:SDR family NAD(P)-dependent oxidoreductase n=1 Tax=Myxococcus TaxID=32 RepID=UPI001CBED573|nr:MULTISPECIES: glucose 1-dehydrogenase [unclassified Myxococcus]MBZ4402365.1 glucose 1-dehydrogenase [Myxococcus sp. AS-1-15]MBZ4412815.1 glucose 1-dehydrogenase [Myxococcus sp. XM-1-1-1]BDT32629.1 glucose 1-dehydrogenase [Myxococcus sp. MH1]